jgi:hypothetical protein
LVALRLAPGSTLAAIETDTARPGEAAALNGFHRSHKEVGKCADETGMSLIFAAVGLIALVSVLALVRAVREAAEGCEDNEGFHWENPSDAAFEAAPRRSSIQATDFARPPAPTRAA